MRSTEPVTLRLAGPGDSDALHRLAGLDSQPLPPGPHLVAEREGRIAAALSLSVATLIADPFRHTAELCELLRHRASALHTTPRRGRRRPRPRAILEAG